MGANIFESMQQWIKRRHDTFTSIKIGGTTRWLETPGTTYFLWNMFLPDDNIMINPSSEDQAGDVKIITDFW